MSFFPAIWKWISNNSTKIISPYIWKLKKIVEMVKKLDNSPSSSGEHATIRDNGQYFLTNFLTTQLARAYDERLHWLVFVLFIFTGFNFFVNFFLESPNNGQVSLFKRLAWPAFQQGNFSRKSCQCLVVHTSKWLSPRKHWSFLRGLRLRTTACYLYV